MAVKKGTKRYQHNETGEVRYFTSPPNLEKWSKVGTAGSKDWCWINNTVEEKFVRKSDPLLEGYTYGRIRV